MWQLTGIVLDTENVEYDTRSDDADKLHNKYYNKKLRFKPIITQCHYNV